MSLKKKTIHGLFWTLGQQLSNQAISLVVQIILARLLMPEVFGLIAMLAIFIAIGKSLADSGMTSSLIRTQHADQRDYSTVFFLNLGLSVVIYLFIFFSAPFVSDFYNQPLLTNILRVYSTTIIIQSLVSVQVTRLTKAMNFKFQMLMELPATIIGSGFGVWLAFNGYGVWSLVWMHLIRTSIWAFMLWFFSGWRPDFIFDKVKFKSHLNFGYKLTLSGLLETIYANSYNILIGKFFSAAQLGYYDRASTFRNIPLSTISSALYKVTYPMFSSIQNEDDRLKLVYKKIMQQVLFWVAPLMVFCLIIAEPAFRWILTEKWLPAVPFFQILCVAGILFPLHVYNLNILNVKGRSDLFLRLEIIKKIMITIIIIAAIPFGIFGLVYSQIITTFLAFLINSFYSGRLINYPTLEQIKDILPVLLLVTICGLITWGLYIFFGDIIKNDLLLIAINGVLFGGFYIGGAHLFKISAVFEFKQLFLKSG